MTVTTASRDARFEELYREHAPAVLAYVLRRVARPFADDALADTFLVAWRRLEDVPSDARPWLLGVARNVVANYRRAATRQAALTTKLGGASAEHAPADEERSDHRAIEALARLRARDREVLMLAAWEELTAPEAARVLGCSAVTFRLRLHRARKRLRRELESLDEDELRTAERERINRIRTETA